MKDIFKVGKYKFKSRLIVGTGKYKNFRRIKINRTQLF